MPFRTTYYTNVALIVYVNFAHLPKKIKIDSTKTVAAQNLKIAVKMERCLLRAKYLQ